VALSLLIVDDSAEFLAAARALLEGEGVAVLGVAATGSDALLRVGELRPDVVLVDIDLGVESGFELARRIAMPATSVILISIGAEEDWGPLIAESPAAGFISKSELLARAIRCVVAGQSDDGASASPGT